MELVANNNNFKVQTVSIGIVVLMENQFPLVPAFLVSLGHSEQLELAGICLFQSENIFILGIGRNQNSCLSPIPCVCQGEFALNAVVCSSYNCVAQAQVIHLVAGIGIGGEGVDIFGLFLKEVGG